MFKSNTQSDGGRIQLEHVLITVIEMNNHISAWKLIKQSQEDRKWRSLPSRDEWKCKDLSDEKLISFVIMFSFAYVRCTNRRNVISLPTA